MRLTCSCPPFIEEVDGEHGHQRRPRYDREDPLQKLKRETIQIAESPLVKIEDAVRNLATAYISIFDNEDFRTGYLSCLHDLYATIPVLLPSRLHTYTH